MRLAVAVSVALSLTVGVVPPSPRSDVVAYYDFDHPMPGDPARERDLGRSSTEIELIGGGAAQRVRDAAYPGAGRALQTRPGFKAGVWSATGVRTLHAFNAVRGTTVSGWFKLSMDSPATGFSAIGLAGILSGTSDGHTVRALIEVMEVDDTLRLVALGRRIDGGASQIYAASEDWRTLLPKDRWVHLAATFDFGTGRIALYRNGVPIAGVYTEAGDPWQVSGPGPHVTSATDPRGIKIGGSFPQNAVERNPCDCRMDALTFISRSLSARDVARQYHSFLRRG
ncbi:LamG-like jellyroll fold domain-containing protein [Actinoplanes sp. NBRC 101535]|uniref:LamG-like jellyroll fold domain-containing protein n=1 Tax=Actinoplanes sp. NBRC 101535 TaxID=3032196 RepID=UPI0024A1E464|nr:LamG-like jellyroll fold domain-containing protein [Actinoplanes sp. NBRC 101535]GLY06170.1 hypothetical protein Acsp01_65490 [Actinoplanes sp. NBRC 101535]